MEEQVRWLLTNHLCILWFGKLLKLEWCWRQIGYKVTRLFPSLFSIRETNLCYASSVDTKLLYFPAPTVMRPWKPSTNWQGTVREKYVIIFTPPPLRNCGVERGGGGGGGGGGGVRLSKCKITLLGFRQQFPFINLLFIYYISISSFIYLLLYSFMISLILSHTKVQ